MYKHTIVVGDKKYFNQGSKLSKSAAESSAKRQKHGFEMDHGYKALVKVQSYISFGKKKYGVYLHPTKTKITVQEGR